MIVYLAGAIQAFVMYCVNGTSRSSLLIESVDSMININCTSDVQYIKEFYIGGFVNSLSRLRLRIARLYLHCGISHWADI